VHRALATYQTIHRQVLVASEPVVGVVQVAKLVSAALLSGSFESQLLSQPVSAALLGFLPAPSLIIV
jgi:hypothetical protein